MHHAKRLITVMILSSIFTTTTAHAAKDGLVKVERPECLNFPKILEFSKAVEGVHYVSGTDIDCDEDFKYCRKDYKTLKTKYVYTSVKSFDYYSSEGKLITSETLKTAHNMDDSKYLKNDGAEEMWNDLAKTLRAKISLEIYQHETGACETSFYKE